MPLSPRLWGPGRTAHFASPTPASLHTGLALRVDLLREGQSRNAQASATSGLPVSVEARCIFIPLEVETEAGARPFSLRLKATA